MITFSKLGEFGRLGNQLFQYSILLAVGNKNNYEIKIPLLENKEWHGQKCLLNNFNITAKTLENTDVIENYYDEREHNNSLYDSSIFNIPDNCDILGYFGDYRYIKDYEDLIIKELTLKKEVVERNTKKMIEIKEKYKNHLIVSLHIRRGDQSIELYSNDGIELDVDSTWFKYFKESKRAFEGKKCKFLIFTGGSRTNETIEDYEWCKNNFKSEEYIFCDGYDNSTIDDFAMMYLSDAHILSPISTMSWWIGFLNKNKNKIIVSPEKFWFGNTCDLLHAGITNIIKFQ